MGRESYKSRRNREFPGCMSGVLHLFDFNQALTSRKLLQDTRFCEGLEAPRNSLDIPSGIMEFRRHSEANLDDIPFGFEFPKKEGAKTKLEDAPRKSLKDLPTESEQKRRTPNVVARLMGLELMPDEPVFVDHSRRNSVSGKQFLNISVDKQEKVQKPSRIQTVKTPQNALKSPSFREHPQEKQLEEFKREFEARQSLHYRDHSQYFEAEEHNNIRSAPKQTHGHYDEFVSREKYMELKPRQAGQERQTESRKFLNAMDFLHKNKDFFLNVLQDSKSSKKKFSQPKERAPAEWFYESTESAYHPRSKPPVGDEVVPFRCSRNGNKSKFSSSNNNTRSSGSPQSATIVVLKPTSESPRASNVANLPLKFSKNEPKQSNNSSKPVKLSKEMTNPREIAREIVKQAKEDATRKVSKEINTNQHFACSSSSSFGRRNMPRVESMDLEAESPSTLKKHSCHSGKSSPRMANSPRVNRSMEEINKDDGSKPADCSQSKSISPRLRAAASQSKWKPDDRKKLDTVHTIDRTNGTEDVGTNSPRMLSRSRYLPIDKRDARVSSSSSLTSKKKTESEKFPILNAKHIAISVGKMRKNGTKDVCRKAGTSAVTNPLAVHAEATSQAIRDTLARLDAIKKSQAQKAQYQENVYTYRRISSPKHRELASTSLENKEKMLQQRSEDVSSSSVDKKLNGGRKWSCGEVGYALSDEKCEHPSPVSVLDGPFQEESPSPVDLKETPTNLHELRTKLCLLELDREGSCDSDQESKASFPSNSIPREKKLSSKCFGLQNGNFEGLRVDGIFCPLESKTDLLYVRNILVFAGFHSDSVVEFTRWYSPAHPINPQMFDQLEEYYTNLKPSADNPCMNSCSNRKLIFELVNEILCKKLKPYLNIRPWTNPKKLNLHCMSTGKQLLEEVWSKICSFPRADCKILEDVEALVKKDFANIEEAPKATDEDVEKIGSDVEQHILSSLIEEAVVDLLFSV